MKALSAILLLAVARIGSAQLAAGPDLAAIASDLVVPPVSEGGPAAGKRVRVRLGQWEGTEVYHLLYLPEDWRPGARFPLLVEYPGNGNYRNKFGDVSDGTVEGGMLGHGMSGGRGFIWLCLPYLEAAAGTWRNARQWWGDLAESKRYCLAAIDDACANHGGDRGAVILCGFSRGSIGCNYFGLHDDEIAAVWRGFVCHSHYDGVNEKWPYPGADRDSALERLQRLNGRPQFISHEMSTAPIEAWLREAGIKGNFVFAPIPFRNHSAAWVLRDLPQRHLLREWLARVVGER